MDSVPPFPSDALTREQIAEGEAYADSPEALACDLTGLAKLFISCDASITDKQIRQKLLNMIKVAHMRASSDPQSLTFRSISKCIQKKKMLHAEISKSIAIARGKKKQKSHKGGARKQATTTGPKSGPQGKVKTVKVKQEHALEYPIASERFGTRWLKFKASVESTVPEDKHIIYGKHVTFEVVAQRGILEMVMMLVVHLLRRYFSTRPESVPQKALRAAAAKHPAVAQDMGYMWDTNRFALLVSLLPKADPGRKIVLPPVIKKLSKLAGSRNGHGHTDLVAECVVTDDEVKAFVSLIVSLQKATGDVNAVTYIKDLVSIVRKFLPNTISTPAREVFADEVEDDNDMTETDSDSESKDESTPHSSNAFRANPLYPIGQDCGGADFKADDCTDDAGTEEYDNEDNRNERALKEKDLNEKDYYEDCNRKVIIPDYIEKNRGHTTNIGRTSSDGEAGSNVEVRNPSLVSLRSGRTVQVIGTEGGGEVESNLTGNLK